jgi:hypothetical protein
MEVTMPWRLIAKAFGWRSATEEDSETPVLVVWQPRLGQHFTGSDAWKRAVRVSVHAPEPYPCGADRKEVRP